MSENIINNENIGGTTVLEESSLGKEKIIATDTDLGGVYVPSSIERKRAVMMYMLFGIIITISSKKVNSFEYFHLKQSMGWRSCFIVVLIIAIILMFLPGIRYVGLVALFTMVVCFVIVVKQAWDGKYYSDIKKYGFLGFFPSLGAWVVNVFEIGAQEENTQEQLQIGLTQEPKT